MKKIVTSLMALVLVVMLQAQEAGSDAEKTAIKEVIENAYIDGIFNKGDAEAVKKGWQWDCDINIYIEPRDKVMKSPSYSFVKMFEEGRPALYPGTTFKIPFVHITGYAAIAIVEVFQDDKQVYTDYMNLYKLKKDGWQIITKTYYSHPK